MSGANFIMNGVSAPSKTSVTPRLQPNTEKEDEETLKERAEIVKKVVAGLENKKYKTLLNLENYSRTTKKVPIKRDILAVLAKFKVAKVSEMTDVGKICAEVCQIRYERGQKNFDFKMSGTVSRKSESLIRK